MSSFLHPSMPAAAPAGDPDPVARAHARHSTLRHRLLDSSALVPWTILASSDPGQVDPLGDPEHREESISALLHDLSGVQFADLVLGHHAPRPVYVTRRENPMHREKPVGVPNSRWTDRQPPCTASGPGASACIRVHQPASAIENPSLLSREIPPAGSKQEYATTDEHRWVRAEPPYGAKPGRRVVPPLTRGEPRPEWRAEPHAP